ncbi:COP9 signalosome complex subunit 5 [Myriangium duriaei CBS 260.36]|uniref:COP9 signalosome complex subunit 5 n=1 Tax=Myriangium duriaei CBS 260.36 TaxID=1168546 RepID=A0A9P4IU30_9PEZI|nr:COP9 signalosome complex subunit 5 [Myriangium duriaei CBS 260.36]
MASALKTWELENAVKLVDPRRDALYSFDSTSQSTIRNAKPWKSDPHYFTSVRISAVALLKMVMHARSGGAIEVMGLMQGKIEDHVFVITDAFRLPVEGTETRVNVLGEGQEYMVAFDTAAREAGRPERIVGWYHSHPGYGCWLSGIDVGTQSTWQQWEDPFVAVVVDPDRTVSAGKVEIGAFRCYPEGYVAPDATTGGQGEAAVGNAAVPMAKAADFGKHANRYYPLEVGHYKSGLDSAMLEALWNKYWVQTLSASPLVTNREYGTKQIGDLAGKIEQLRSTWRARGSAGMQAKPGPGVGAAAGAGATDPALDKVVKAAAKIAAEERTGLLAAEVKEKVFGRGQGVKNIQPAQEDVQMQMQDVK